MLTKTAFRKVGLAIDNRLRLHDQIKPSAWWKGRIEVSSRAKDSPLDPDLKEQQDRLKSARKMADPG